MAGQSYGHLYYTFLDTNWASYDLKKTISELRKKRNLKWQRQSVIQNAYRARQLPCNQDNVKYFDPFEEPSETVKESARWRGKQLGLFAQDS